MNPDFTEVFDIGRLTELQLGNVEFILTSPAYTETFKPYLMSIRKNLNTVWLDRSQGRKDMISDDYLAGGIAMIDGLITFFSLVLDESSLDRIHASQSRTPDQQYDALVRAGAAKPVVGMNQEAAPKPYDPAEDF
jgi:hypothetical protein